MNLLSELSDRVTDVYGDRLAAVPQLTHDALTISLLNGIQLQARFASPEEYSIDWRVGDCIWRIDTAPLHAGLASFPNHRHEPDQTVCADTLTKPGAPPWENLSTVLASLVKQPFDSA